MADFQTAVALTLKNEGGYTDNPNDAGHATNMGITQADLPGQDMHGLTVAQATEFYRERYWKPLYAEIEDQAVASKLFDAGVLFGIGAAVSDLQRVVGTYVDGIFGEATLLLTNEANPVTTLANFKAELAFRAHDVVSEHPEDDVFLAGWLRRIAS